MSTTWPKLRAAVGTAQVLADAVGRLPFDRGLRAPAVDHRPRSGAEPIRLGQPLTVLCWNLQFCAGREQVFFYDGGEAVHVPPARVRRTMAAIADVLADQRPDLALLQEIDRDADRTGRIDQWPLLAAALGRGARTSVPYHDKAWVPFPAHQPLGRVGLHLGTWSRPATRGASAIALPRLAEPWLRQQFNLERVVAVTRIAVEDGRTLHVLNTHLSAFSRGDGTLGRQLGVIETALAALPPGDPWILAGDFNALPPGDDPSRLGFGADLYPERSSPLRSLYARHRAALDPSSCLADPATWGTYLPPGRAVADRTIDHVFVSSGVAIRSTEVVEGTESLSDHRPIRLEVVLS